MGLPGKREVGTGFFRLVAVLALLVAPFATTAWAQSQPRFEAAGLKRFHYQARGKTVQLMYYEAPTEVYDDARAMSDWGQLALAAAVRARRPARKKTH